MNATTDTKHWIIRRTGGAYSLVSGEKEEIIAYVDRLNSTDEGGSTEILSGPWTLSDAMEDMDRLEA